MRLFRKSVSLKESGVLKGFTDYHSHILPGVDDGVSALAEALEILACYEKLGIGTVWLTPHIMEDIPNATERLRERFEELTAAYQGSVRLRLAAENMLDSLFEERLEQGDLLPLGEKGNHLLVETSYYNPPMGLYEMLERIKSKGYYPVLAHPERYDYMGEKDYQKLKDMGVKFQLNLFSLDGYYGEKAKRTADSLLKTGAYELTGTDIHSMYCCQYIETMQVNLQRNRSFNLYHKSL